MNLKSKMLICALMMAFNSPLLANSEPEHLDIPHVHGTAHARIAVAENTVVISMQSPLYNILGFEHRVSTPKDLKEFRRAQQVLGNVAPLFDFQGSLCNSVNVELDFSSLTNDKPHSDVHARYDFVCNDASALTSISMPIVNVFPILESINVEWVTDSAAGEASVNAATLLVSFSHEDTSVEE